jgi:replication initiation protein RepC
MIHITTTPFGRRAVSAARQAAHIRAAAAPLPAERPDKWAILRDLTAARMALGLSDRMLTVLEALVSFHPSADLAEGEGTIVYPSNAALSARLRGMPDSTLRRHLAALVAAGLVLRHDSPNGKRYAARDASGGLAVAFGFDLRPLLLRAAEFAAAARAAQEAVLRLKRLRERVVLRLRDASSLVAWAREEGRPLPRAEAEAADLSRRLRRRLDAATLEALASEAEALLAAITRHLALLTEKMSGNDAESGRHHLNSKQMPNFDSEPCHETAKAAAPADPDARRSPEEPRLPLAVVAKACPEIALYAGGDLADWRTLVEAARRVRPMMGVSADAWAEAEAAMGAPVAAVTLACILQRVDRIGRPGGYLRALTRKAQDGGFSPGPMVMALLRAA